MPRRQLLARELLGRRQSVRRRDGDVWLYSRPFPIRLRDRIDCLRKRHADDEALCRLSIRLNQ